MKEIGNEVCMLLDDTKLRLLVNSKEEGDLIQEHQDKSHKDWVNIGQKGLFLNGHMLQDSDQEKDVEWQQKESIISISSKSRDSKHPGMDVKDLSEQ